MPRRAGMLRGGTASVNLIGDSLKGESPRLVLHLTQAALLQADVLLPLGSLAEDWREPVVGTKMPNSSDLPLPVLTFGR
jgi:hypothetical protein